MTVQASEVWNKHTPFDIRPRLLSRVNFNLNMDNEFYTW